ncbi:monocarboxylate transporter 8 [Plakobranchus ocellatus]|uniref:Monocarboxylate transporter 8 n=1 Tax=Plakobranchus ocellatus TaxID=259542 RepID=A0AAV4C9D6_9GAST|nr:monocarboxylate transporter 8 [Plakobranchus ocellatus]
MPSPAPTSAVGTTNSTTPTTTAPATATCPANTKLTSPTAVQDVICGGGGPGGSGGQVSPMTASGVGGEVGGGGPFSVPSSDSPSSGSQMKREMVAMQVAQDVKPVARVDFGNFYPDGGWGWLVLGAATLVHVLTGGLHLAYGSLYLPIQEKFKISDINTAWLGSLGMAVTLFLSPVVTVVCRRKSPRLLGVIGGLVCALGCLFLAFSTQHVQLFISYCLVTSAGSGLTLATANIMVGRYFRRRRELAEMVLVAGSGFGAAGMTALMSELFKCIKWMHGLQAVSGLLVTTIVAAAFYRSANMYHPRRKVILHLKSQKKTRRERQAEKPPYLDFSALKMRSLRAVIVISGIVGLGIHVPFVLLVSTAKPHQKETSRLFLLSVYLGLGFLLGCLSQGYIIVRNSNECRISRRHLCQGSAILCGLLTLLHILANDESSHALYAWAYGFFCGSYYYSLKTYVFELVKAKLMERSWSYLCVFNSLPVLCGAPVACYLNAAYDSVGDIFAGSAMLMGGLLFYAMPWFERHPSNSATLSKHSSRAQYTANMAEAAALLDIDLSEIDAGCGSAKQGRAGPLHQQHYHHHLCVHDPHNNCNGCSYASINGSVSACKGSSNGNSSSSSSGGAGAVGGVCCNKPGCGMAEVGSVRVQLQCFKEPEKQLQQQQQVYPKQQQVILTKISEEKDVACGGNCGRSGSGDGNGSGSVSTPNDPSCRKRVCLSGSHIELSVTKADLSDSPAGNMGGNCSGSPSCFRRKDKLGKGGTSGGKKASKNEVRIELFDPPSQEKESTATVSYDSDLYINLCEAQV